MTLKVHIDTASLERATTGAFLGKIYVSYDRLSFPDRNWSDFAVVIVGWWVRQLTSLASGASSAQFRFMDGPFRFDITSTDGSWQVSMIKNGKTTTTQAAGPIDRVGFMDSLVAAANSLLRACRERGWTKDSEIAELTTAVHDLAAAWH